MGFDDTYGELLGPRWPALRAALQAPGPYSVCLNPLHPDPRAALEAADGAAEGSLRVPGGLSGVLASDEPFPPAPPPSPDGPSPWYAMDAASVLAVRALGVEPTSRVLDMCAAPGGKAWNIAASLGEGGELVANDRSAARRARLHRVLDGMLPPAHRARVRVTGHDASRWALHEPAAYDRVLLDAPCSSEEHVLASPRALAQWSPARSRQLARRQYALLAAAIDATRPGGRILYATCALAPEENDGVVGRTLASRRGASVELARPARSPAELGEPTRHGWAVLPDRTGFGPIYFALFQRREAT